MKTFKFITVFAILFTTISAQTLFEDSCVVRVGNEVITSKDIQDNLEIYKLQFPNVPEDSLKKAILEELINRKLILIAAKKDTSISVSDEEVDKALDNWIQGLKQQFGEKRFNEELKKEGLTLAKLKSINKEKMKEELMIEKYLAKYITPKIRVTEEELRKFYEDYQDSLRKPARFKIAQILIKFKPTPEEDKAVYKKALSVYKKIKSGEPFDKFLRLSDDDLTRDRGGDLGIVNINQFSDTVKYALLWLKPGDISKPVRGEFGWHIFQVVEKKDSFYHLRHIMFKITPSEKDKERAKKRVEKVLKELKKGTPFATLAELYSDDKMSKDLGGELGWMSEYELPPATVDSLKKMKKGEVKVIESPVGYHIVKLLDKEDARKYTFDEVKDNLKQLLLQKKQQEEIKKLIESLKKKIYVGKCEG